MAGFVIANVGGLYVQHKTATGAKMVEEGFQRMCQSTLSISLSFFIRVFQCVMVSRYSEEALRLAPIFKKVYHLFDSLDAVRRSS